ncbi:hypothetical protein DFH08DRAFT_893704 [Mycena albidolilacea]|uniref:Uncharacterized protein n=1 Tax=Mycena albidolilacea TaxID=1033008 RepID=A0AAD6ZCE6_9AGAR|nr:hypothetical protein DFH08DRAFT_893704 [Mycena albidolilacea]
MAQVACTASCLLVEDSGKLGAQLVRHPAAMQLAIGFCFFLGFTIMQLTTIPLFRESLQCRPICIPLVFPISPTLAYTLGTFARGR